MDNRGMTQQELRNQIATWIDHPGMIASMEFRATSGAHGARRRELKVTPAANSRPHVLAWIEEVQGVYEMLANGPRRARYNDPLKFQGR